MTAMTVRTTTNRPDPARDDCGLALFSKWRLPDPGGTAPGSDGRSAALDAIAAVWERDPWPSPGLLGYHLLTGEDGRTLLHHSQWTDDDAFETYGREHRQTRVDEIDAAAPGIERVGLGRYRHYRSGGTGDGARVPGCVVVVEIEFETGPGLGTATGTSTGTGTAKGFGSGEAPDPRRDWVDAVFEALEDDPNPPPGGLSAHFHLSTDGSRVLNYAEWESAQAHINALASPGRGVGGPTEQWKRVQRYPGLKHSSVSRYTPAFALLPA